MVERRVMNMDGVFEVQEKIDGQWAVIGECESIESAKTFLKSLKILEEEE